MRRLTACRVAAVLLVSAALGAAPPESSGTQDPRKGVVLPPIGFDSWEGRCVLADAGQPCVPPGELKMPPPPSPELLERLDQVEVARRRKVERDVAAQA